MLPRSTPLLIILSAIIVIFWIGVFHSLGRTSSSFDQTTFNQHEIDELNTRLDKLNRLVEEEGKLIRGFRHQIREVKLSKNSLGRSVTEKKPPIVGTWPDPIPVLVFVCNRAEAIRTHLEHLIRVRPSAERFPIIVSQDCDNDDVKATVASFGEQVKYIKHLSGAHASIRVPPHHQHYTTYYLIARHYKLALDHVFNTLGHTSVIITEDDLDIAPDLFEYFSSTRQLLSIDPSLWCVSAWNDNGKSDLIDLSEPSRLYRSDFFSGLGWMMTSTLWKEIGPIWPEGFWDDWMRDPGRRQGRACIRPEISRTAMTVQGKKGASQGLFFDKHLIKVQLNTQPVNFTQLDLRYLTKENFDKDFIKLVYEDSILMTADDVQKELVLSGRERPIRIEYNANMDYIKKADILHIMHDFKAGVPRTAYNGIVSCFINGRRVFLAPDRNVIRGYDPQWAVPDNM